MPVKPFGVVLAGGRSSRMGKVRKPLALLDDEPMLARVINRTLPQVQELFVSVEPGDNELAGFGCKLIEDEVPRHRGPLAGLYSTLIHMQRARLEGPLLICPCDAPFIPTNLAESLLAASNNEPGTVAVVSYEGFLQPTFSLWSMQHLPAVRAAVTERGQIGLKRLLTALPYVKVDWAVSEPPPFYNINSPDQLDAAQQWLAQ